MLRKVGRIVFSRGWLLVVVALGVCTSGCFYEGHGGGGWHHHHHDW